MERTKQQNRVTAAMTQAEIDTMAQEASESGLIIIFAGSVLIGLWSSACFISTICQNGLVHSVQALFTAAGI